MWTSALPPSPRTLPSRRQMLHRAAGGFGALALAGIWGDVARGGSAVKDPLAPRAGHFPAAAKSVIFIFSMGGVSHVDTFDYKPKLYESHGKTFGATGQFLKKPHWNFKQHGRSGTHVADI